MSIYFQGTLANILREQGNETNFLGGGCAGNMDILKITSREQRNMITYFLGKSEHGYPPGRASYMMYAGGQDP